MRSKGLFILLMFLIVFRGLSFSQGIASCFKDPDNGEKIEGDYILTKDSVLHRFPEGIKRTAQRFGKLKISDKEEYKYADMLAFQMGETNYRVIDYNIYRRIVSGKINVYQSTLSGELNKMYLQKGGSNNLVYLYPEKGKGSVYDLVKDNESAKGILEGHLAKSKKVSHCELAEGVNAYNF